MSPLTPVQKRLLQQIVAYVDDYGFAPSIRELGDLTGLVSSSSVVHQLRNLEAKGYIRRAPGLNRALVILEREDS